MVRLLRGHVWVVMTLIVRLRSSREETGLKLAVGVGTLPITRGNNNNISCPAGLVMGMAMGFGFARTGVLGKCQVRGLMMLAAL
jgi:hypothetical protein